MFMTEKQCSEFWGIQRGLALQNSKDYQVLTHPFPAFCVSVSSVEENAFMLSNSGFLSAYHWALSSVVAGAGCWRLSWHLNHDHKAEATRKDPSLTSQACLQWHTSPSRATSPNPLQTVLSSGAKCSNTWAYGRHSHSNHYSVLLSLLWWCRPIIPAPWRLGHWNQIK